MASRGELLAQSARNCRNVVRSSLAVLAGCGTAFWTSIPSRKGGDMACTRGGFGSLGLVHATACTEDCGATILDAFAGRQGERTKPRVRLPIHWGSTSACRQHIVRHCVLSCDTIGPVGCGDATMGSKTSCRVRVKGGKGLVEISGRSS